MIVDWWDGRVNRFRDNFVCSRCVMSTIYIWYSRVIFKQIRYSILASCWKKLQIRPYPRHKLLCTFEILSRGKMKANWRSEQFLLYKISCLIWKNWSRLLIRTISRELFPKTDQKWLKMRIRKFSNFSKSIRIDPGSFQQL